MTSAAVLLSVVDALGNVEGLTPPAYRAIIKCAANVLLVEAAPAPSATAIEPAPAKQRGRPKGRKRKPAEIAEARRAASRKWRLRKKAKVAAEKPAAKVKGKRGSDSAAAHRGWATRRLAAAQAERKPAANGDVAPATNGAASEAKAPMYKRSDPRLKGAKALLQAHLKESSFIPKEQLRREAIAAGLDTTALASAATHLGLKVSHRGSTEGFELKTT